MRFSGRYQARLRGRILFLKVGVFADDGLIKSSATAGMQYRIGERPACSFYGFVSQTGFQKTELTQSYEQWLVCLRAIQWRR
ncbi:hypothetical protein [uncultured Ruegeria sp.]|uniref:hypothetical protein n=1 Tax=uncultured Ruegeria sp. TaxID=259304 RepID=UPI00260B48A4|nr:hypothetical protein [uncultured Ruegeria sp.]